MQRGQESQALVRGQLLAGQVQLGVLAGGNVCWTEM